MSTDDNISVKEYKIIELKDLEMEIEKIWQLKVTTLPVIVRALAMTKNDTNKHVYQILGYSNLDEMQGKALSRSVSSNWNNRTDHH